jgi:hypothetical protein
VPVQLVDVDHFVGLFTAGVQGLGLAGAVEELAPLLGLVGGCLEAPADVLFELVQFLFYLVVAFLHSADLLALVGFAQFGEGLWSFSRLVLVGGVLGSLLPGFFLAHKYSVRL